MLSPRIPFSPTAHQLRIQPKPAGVTFDDPPRGIVNNPSEILCTSINGANTSLSALHPNHEPTRDRVLRQDDK